MWTAVKETLDTISASSSKRLWFVDTVLWLCPSQSIKRWLPNLMQESFWWWQCSDRFIISLFPHLHTPSLISLMVSVDVKHHLHLPANLGCLLQTYCCLSTGQLEWVGVCLLAKRLEWVGVCLLAKRLGWVGVCLLAKRLGWVGLCLLAKRLEWVGVCLLAKQLGWVGVCLLAKQLGWVGVCLLAKRLEWVGVCLLAKQLGWVGVCLLAKQHCSATSSSYYHGNATAGRHRFPLVLKRQ